MHFDTVRIFLDLVELRNFSRTAEKHGISQSAVSQQLAQLETRHKCQLINRKKRPLALTTSGEIFYQACKDMINRYGVLQNDLAGLANSMSRLNISAIFSIGMHTLQPCVKKMMVRFPEVTPYIDYCSATQIYARVIEGQSDIGIVAVPRNSRNIDIYPLENEPLVLVCHPNHPLASQTLVDVHMLDGVKFISFAKRVPSRMLIDNILNQYNVTTRIVMEFDNVETIKRAVEINAGVSILPKTTIHAEINSKSLRAIYFSNENFSRPTAVILRKNRVLSHAGKHLIELLRK